MAGVVAATGCAPGAARVLARQGLSRAAAVAVRFRPPAAACHQESRAAGSDMSPWVFDTSKLPRLNDDHIQAARQMAAKINAIRTEFKDVFGDLSHLEPMVLNGASRDYLQGQPRQSVDQVVATLLCDFTDPILAHGSQDAVSFLPPPPENSQEILATPGHPKAPLVRLYNNVDYQRYIRNLQSGLPSVLGGNTVAAILPSVKFVPDFLEFAHDTGIPPAATGVQSIPALDPMYSIPNVNGTPSTVIQRAAAIHSHPDIANKGFHHHTYASGYPFGVHQTALFPPAYYAFTYNNLLDALPDNVHPHLSVTLGHATPGDMHHFNVMMRILRPDAPPTSLHLHYQDSLAPAAAVHAAGTALVAAAMDPTMVGVDVNRFPDGLGSPTSGDHDNTGFSGNVTMMHAILTILATGRRIKGLESDNQLIVALAHIMAQQERFTPGSVDPVRYAHKDTLFKGAMEIVDAKDATDHSAVEVAMNHVAKTDFSGYEARLLEMHKDGQLKGLSIPEIQAALGITSDA